MRTFFRWLPAVLAPVIVAGAVAVPVAIANATPNLPTRSAAQILALSTHGKDVAGFTGEYAQDSNLGLPALPTDLLTGGGATNTATKPASGSSAAASEALSNTIAYLSADQRGRISVGNPGVRIQSYAGQDEQDTVLTSGNLWLWDSKTQHATHIKLPTLTAAQRKKLDAVITLATPDKPVYTPQQLADGVLDSLDTHTRVTVGKAQYVAGQGAYTLVFTPRERASLIRDIRVNIDGKTGMELRVSVYAKATADPAYQFGYTTLRYAQPDPSTFRFVPAPQAKVTTQDYSAAAIRKKYQTENRPEATTSLPRFIAGLTGSASGLTAPKTTAGDAVKVSGTGWASVVHVAPSQSTRDLAANKQVRSLTTVGSDGSRVLSTTLFNIKLESDGRVSFGSVPVSML